MNRSTNSRRHSQRRRGTAAVEAALILPLLIIISFGAIDVAQYINLAQLVNNASREGARIASRNTTNSVQEIEDAVKDYFTDQMPHLSAQQLGDGLDVEVRRGWYDENLSSNQLDEIESGDPLTVNVMFDFKVVRWIGGPSYWNGNVNNSKTTCRRE